MIRGIGIDTVVISRMERLIESRGDRFLRKVFSLAEIEEGKARAGRAAYFAVRFAAREAFFKALGTGVGRGLSIRDVSVAKEAQGKPVLLFSERVEEVLRAEGITRSHVSLSHDGENAIATVILETP